MLKAGLAIGCVLMIADPFAALAGERRTSLALKAPNCHFKSASEGLDCKGPDGWSVAIGYHTLRRSVIFIPPGKESGDMRDAADGRAAIPVDIAPPAMVRWLTSAAIVPMLIVRPDDFERVAEIGTGVGGVPTKRILAVFRLGAVSSCVIAYIDAADPAADALATEAAAGAGRTRCPVSSIATPGQGALTLAAFINKE